MGPVLGQYAVAGARANRLDSRVGTLTSGKNADILLRMDAINVLPVNNAHGAIMPGMDTSNVDRVIIGGEIRKRRGQLAAVDLGRIRQQAEASRDDILATTGWCRTRIGSGVPAR